MAITTIAVLLYEGFTALDAIGPYEVLSRLPGAQLRFIAEQVGVIRSDTNGISSNLALTVDTTLDDLAHPDIIVIPGGSAGTIVAAQNQRIQAWLRSAHETSQWTTSICTGAFILGAVGILNGLHATTHWASRNHLAHTGATYVGERFVREGKIITAAGVSAGIDMALFLVGELRGTEQAESLQLAIEVANTPSKQARSCIHRCMAS